MDIDSLITFKVKQLEKDILIISNEVGVGASYIYQDAIESTVYRIPEGQYERTRALLNSVRYDVTKFNNMIQIKIDTDPNLMNSEHQSWVDGSNQNENISAWINYGHHGIVDYTPANYVELANNKIKVVALKQIKKGLKNMGYKVR